MSFISSNTKVALISTATVVVTAFTSYALYFDYKRRNDPVFRKSLIKQTKKVQRNTAQQQASGTQDKVLALQRALLLINAEPIPAEVDGKEQYFMDQVAMGEQLAIRDHPDFNIASAISFYKALRVYPAPMELLAIYEKTQPPAVFDLVMMMISLNETASKDIRDISSSALLTEIDPPVPTPVPSSESAPATASSENGSSPPSTGSYVDVAAEEVESMGTEEVEVVVVVEEEVSSVDEVEEAVSGEDPPEEILVV